VLKSFRRCLETVGHVESVSAHVDLLERRLRGGLGHVIIATPAGHPEYFLGWAAEEFGALVFAYVPGRLRGNGFFRQMVADLFGDGGPVRLVYWTDYAERIKRAGFPLEHDWQEFAARQQRASRRSPRPQWNEERTT
jgi:hypothetical protein